jgi:hypothetical protein
MRRVLASLLVLLLTISVVARGVAAPLLHLHPAQPAPVTAAAAHEHDHVDCELSAAGETDDAQPSAASEHDQAVPKHGKGCDTNGACCGPLALLAAAAIVGAAQAAAQPCHMSVGTGVTPDNPDRPPSLPLA